ncbi:MAG: hypothetical protein AAFY88_29220 [Acidobacteriota bacterium]
MNHKPSPSSRRLLSVVIVAVALATAASPLSSRGLPPGADSTPYANLLATLSPALEAPSTAPPVDVDPTVTAEGLIGEPGVSYRVESRASVPGGVTADARLRDSRDGALRYEVLVESPHAWTPDWATLDVPGS